MEKLEEWISEGGVHANGFSRMIAPDAMASKTFLEKSLLVRATAVELAWGSHSGRKRAAFAARVVPRTEGISRAIQGAKMAYAGFRAGFPRSLERCGLG